LRSLPKPNALRSRAAKDHQERGESVRTIIIALAANLIIAIAKLIAGLMSHSTAMLAEAAHSLADSLNEVLLGISLRRAKQPAHQDHPLGHGREQFLWAFMAAIGSFLIGGCFSIGMAIRSLEKGTRMEKASIAWIVLAVSFIADGISLIQSVRHARRQAGEFRLPFWQYLRRASDPTVRAVVVEDSAALIGIVIAAIGLLASEMTKSSTPDGIASLLIGILLAITAVGLARPLADFLVGRSVHRDDLEKLHAILVGSPAVDGVVSLQAVYTGPEEVVVAAKIRPRTSMSTTELAAAMDELDRQLRAESSLVADVYLDLTTRRSE
jgi:cation diffusion facilitator family transporter